MLLRIASAAFVFATMTMAQTLSLVSGNGQLVKYATGTGSAPIVFSLTNGTSPVANQTITFTNSDGSVATSLVPESAVTNASGLATVSFNPAFIGDNPFEAFSLQAHYGSQVVTFTETSAQNPSSLLSAPVPAMLEPLVAKADQNGPTITVKVESSFATPIANVAVRVIPIETGAAIPPSTVVQTVTCSQAVGVPEGNVFTNTSGAASCTPVFTYPNAALSSVYDSFTFKISVGDSTFFGPFPYNISPAPLTISGPPAGTILLEGVASNIVITGTGGVPPYTFSLAPTSGLLPGGLVLNANGQITGSSNTPGLFPFTVVLKDHTGAILDSPKYAIAISEGAFADSPTTIPDAVVGQPYSQSISVSGGVPPYKLSINGTLANGLVATPDPSGLSITISGTPTVASNAAIGIKATDAVGALGAFTLFAFQVVPALVVPPVNDRVAVVSTPFQFQVPISGGIPPYTVSATGLPSGLAVNATGLIFGISTAVSGQYTVTVSVGDSIGLTASTTFHIDLSGGTIGLSGSTTVPLEQAGVAFSQPISVSGGVPPYTFTATPSPDQNLSISATGILTGTISASGSQVVSFSVTDVTGQTASLTLSLLVQPVVGVGGIANSASFLGGSVAPGEIVSIFGNGLGPDTGVGAALTPQDTVSTFSAGTQVLFGTFAAPILYVSATQINVVVPFEVLVGQNVAVTVTSNGQVSLPASVPVVQAVPGIFIAGGANSPQQAAVLNQDSSLNGPANPAAAGSVIVVYATGGGVLSSAVADGELPGDATLVNVADTTLTVGGQPATIDFAGLAPGYAGLLQINATLPAGLPAGTAVPVVLTLGGVSSTAQLATIAVQ